MPHLTVGESIIQDELLLDPFWQTAYNTRRLGGSAKARVEAVSAPTPSELNDGRACVRIITRTD